MSTKYSSGEIFDIIANRKQFEEWIRDESEVDLAVHVRKCVIVAVNEELTPCQKMYFDRYFLQGFSIQAIAEEYHVNRSTVSRVLTAAKKRLRKVLRYSAPQLLNADTAKRNRRIKYNDQ